MQITIHQSISIYMIKIGSLTNSSVFQIGSAGNIQAKSDAYNTGGFTAPAKPAVPPGALPNPIVPLSGETIFT